MSQQCDTLSGSHQRSTGASLLDAISFYIHHNNPKQYESNSVETIVVKECQSQVVGLMDTGFRRENNNISCHFHKKINTAK